MKGLIEIRVVWNSRIDGGLTAFAEETKGGYQKGEDVAIIPCKLTNMPVKIAVLPKPEHHAAI